MRRKFSRPAAMRVLEVPLSRVGSLIERIHTMKPKATVIICPGGAYSHLSPRESEPIAAAFEKMGCETDILRYSVRVSADRPPLGLEPVRQLSDRVAAARAAGRPVIACGFSAGGHLAATLGVHWNSLGLCRPDGMILCYPVITADPQYCNAESIRNIALEKDRSFYSLEKHVSPDTPPAFLWHTASDDSVPVENTLVFATALSRCEVPFELHIYPFGAHGLSLATAKVAEPEKGRIPDAHVAGWIVECEAWIDQLVKSL